MLYLVKVRHGVDGSPHNGTKNCANKDLLGRRESFVDKLTNKFYHNDPVQQLLYENLAIVEKINEIIIELNKLSLTSK